MGHWADRRCFGRVIEERWEENYEVHGCVNPPKLVMKCPRLLLSNMIDGIQQLLHEDPSLLLDEIGEWLALYHDQLILTTATYEISHSLANVSNGLQLNAMMSTRPSGSSTWLWITQLISLYFLMNPAKMTVWCCSDMVVLLVAKMLYNMCPLIKVLQFITDSLGPFYFHDSSLTSLWCHHFIIHFRHRNLIFWGVYLWRRKPNSWTTNSSTTSWGIPWTTLGTHRPRRGRLSCWSLSTFWSKSSSWRSTPVLTLQSSSTTPTATNDIQPTHSSQCPSSAQTSSWMTQNLQWICRQSQCLDQLSTRLPHDQWHHLQWQLKKRLHLPCCSWEKGQWPPGPPLSQRRYSLLPPLALEPGIASTPISRNLSSTSTSRMSQSHGSPPPPSQKPYHLEITSPSSRTMLPSVKSPMRMHSSTSLWEGFLSLSWKESMPWTQSPPQLKIGVPVPCT